MQLSKSYLTKRFRPKVNVIARLEFELAYNDSAVQGFNNYTAGTSSMVSNIPILHQ